MPYDATECLAEHNSKLQSLINCMPQLQPLCSAALVLMYYRRDEGSSKPCAMIEHHSILAPTRDSNQGPPDPQSRVATTTLPLHTGVTFFSGEETIIPTYPCLPPALWDWAFSTRRRLMSTILNTFVKKNYLISEQIDFIQKLHLYIYILKSNKI